MVHFLFCSSQTSDSFRLIHVLPLNDFQVHTFRCTRLHTHTIMEELPTLRHWPKRTHRKVRTGCTICKISKVKVSGLNERGASRFPESAVLTASNFYLVGQCDEKKPQCSRCIKQGTRCDISSGDTKQPSTPLSVSSISAQMSLRLNMLDLELIHHWTLSTHDSLTSHPLLRPFWLRNAVKVGFRCAFVMRTILALSAVHLGTLNPERREVLLQHALTHQNLAATTAREFIHPGVHIEDTEMQENLFLYSVLVLFYGRFMMSLVKLGALLLTRYF